MYAHSLINKPTSQWHTLESHSETVAAIAADFAAAFNSSHWAHLIGLLHDLGKARASFQSYLKYCNGLTDPDYDGSEHSHSGVGAVWAAQKYGKIGRILAYCIAGHHAGLPDWLNGETPNGALAYRLQEEAAILDEPQVAIWMSTQLKLSETTKLAPPWKLNGPDMSFWIRMLYSCLVDADFLDTEAFMDPERAMARGDYPGLTELSALFFTALNAKEEQAATTDVNRIRAAIRQSCEEAATLSTGLFSLTAPTGGGKTLSSTAFALRHALHHNLNRIIYVIPYTSIIEQTADVLRSFFGTNNVVEHHSNFEPSRETRSSDLATENWDAPIIVTTNVQFFESLYACRSGRCRKLHNIARSVVILDEAQLLPPKLLLPCVEALKQLTTHYGATILLSTATQPALPGLDNVREIIPPTLQLYKQLKRVSIKFPTDLTTRQTWEEVAHKISEHEQVLCIVNSRKDCYELHKLMPPDTIHLSALMCGAHRSSIIASVKDALAMGKPIRVISTQLVEAGVDIDFPVVYRAFTGLPSIAQAAGRCNREGSLAPALGKVIVFMPPEPCKVTALRKAEDTTLDLLSTGQDTDAPDSYPRFFEHFYGRQNDLGASFHDWLSKDAYDLQFQFREAASSFRMIDQSSVPIIIRYADNDSLISSLITVGPKRNIMRRLQRYTVTVPRSMVVSLKQKGFIEEPHDGIFIQTIPSLYSMETGLDIFRGGLTTEECII